MRVFEGRPAPLNKMRARRIEGAEVDFKLPGLPKVRAGPGSNPNLVVPPGRPRLSPRSAGAHGLDLALQGG